MRMTTVYNAEGEAFEVSNLNAIDMTRHGGYTYKSPNPVEPSVVETVKEPEAVKEPENGTAPMADEVVNFQSLEAEAKIVSDTDSVEDYLKSKSPEALRTILEQRYGEKVHGRTGRDKLVEMILELEESTQSEED